MSEDNDIYTAQLYTDFEVPSWDKNQQLQIIILFIILWGCILIAYKIIPNSFFIEFLFLVLFFYGTLVLPILSWFKTEEHTKVNVGLLTIKKDKLILGNREVNWNEIYQIKVSFFDFEGKYQIGVDGNEAYAKRSSGIKNTIYLLINEQEYQYNFLIKSEKDIDKIEKLFYEIIANNNISYENAKNMVPLKNYEAHQQLKKLIKNRDLVS